MNTGELRRLVLLAALATVAALAYTQGYYDRAGNKRNFVGEGFELPSYRLATKQGLMMLFAGDVMDKLGLYYQFLPPAIRPLRADMVVIGLTPHLDFNNAVTFCNVTGCHNGAFVKSGDVLRHLRLHTTF